MEPKPHIAYASGIPDLLDSSHPVHHHLLLPQFRARGDEEATLLINVTFSTSNKTTTLSNSSTWTSLSYRTDDANDDPTYLSIRHFQKCIIPVLCFVGLVGNLTSIVIFRGRTLKKKSCCVYLTTKCVTDSLFLAALFVVWLDR